MCFRKAKWKREVVNDHKFDFVCIDDFRKNDASNRIKFIWLYLVVIKTILVYIADLWTAGILLIFDKWTINPSIDIRISKWIYVGCIFMSFLLLLLEWKKARSIIASRDISYAFTSIIASRYYALRSYAHHCFFCEINKQKKKVDRLAFFVFFTFKGMKKLIFAEAPRQAINAVTLYKLVQTNITKDWMNFSAYGSDPIERLAMALMAFTLLVFVISASKLAFAFILYIPLLFHIRGNLKEYCCHKIDKRIDELLKKQTNKRRLKLKMIERAMAKGDINRLKKKDILLTLKQSRRQQPTLPTLSGDDDDDYSISDYNNVPIYNNNQSSSSYEPTIPPLPHSPHFNNRSPLPPPPPPSTSRLNLPHDLNRRSPSPHGLSHDLNIRPPSPHGIQHDLSRRPPSPHGFTYNSGSQTNSPGLSRVRYPHGNPNNVNVPPVPPVPVRFISQNERFNHNLHNPPNPHPPHNNHNNHNNNPNYYNQYNYNQYGYGRR